MTYEEYERLSKELHFKVCCIQALEAKLERIKNVLTGPASNQRFMQIAGPARQVLNIIKEDIVPDATRMAERTYPKSTSLFPPKCTSS